MIRRMMRMLDSLRMMRRKTPRRRMFRLEIPVLSSYEFSLSHFV
jgi:hypothetical protein